MFPKVALSELHRSERLYTMLLRSQSISYPVRISLNLGIACLCHIIGMFVKIADELYNVSVHEFIPLPPIFMISEEAATLFANY